MPDNKLVIRRLPPSMSEDDLLKHLEPLPDHDYFCFFEAKPGLGSNSFSRAYITLLDAEDMKSFRERFDNYIFLDDEGHEYPAVVEQAMWHRSPRSGPFFKNVTECLELSGDVDRSSQGEAPQVGLKHLVSSIEEDQHFMEFIEKLQAQKRGPQNSPIQTLENNLDKLTNPSNLANTNDRDTTKVMTPLIDYVIQQRNMKGSKKSR